MQHPAWTLVIVGLVIAGIGAAWLLAPHIPWLGRLSVPMQIWQRFGVWSGSCGRRGVEEKLWASTSKQAPCAASTLPTAVATAYRFTS